MSFAPRFPAKANRHHPKTLLERFEMKVERVPFLPCHVWIGASIKHGYGSFRWVDRSMPAHQAAYRLYKGEPNGVVRHTCDNPWCVNPDHLLEGTQADNVRDMVERGRVSKHSRKLTQKEAEDIRASSLEGRALATLYGVHESTICKIRKGYRYAF